MTVKVTYYNVTKLLYNKHNKAFEYVVYLIGIAERVGFIVFEIKTKTISVVRSFFWRAIQKFSESAVILLLAFLSFKSGQSNKKRKPNRENEFLARFRNFTSNYRD